MTFQREDENPQGHSRLFSARARWRWASWRPGLKLLGALGRFLGAAPFGIWIRFARRVPREVSDSCGCSGVTTLDAFAAMDSLGDSAAESIPASGAASSGIAPASRTSPSAASTPFFLRCGNAVVGAQGFAGQRLELLQAGQFVHVAETEAHQKIFRGAIQDRPPDHRLASRGSDQAPSSSVSITPAQFTPRISCSSGWVTGCL